MGWQYWIIGLGILFVLLSVILSSPIGPIPISQTATGSALLVITLGAVSVGMVLAGILLSLIGIRILGHFRR